MVPSLFLHRLSYPKLSELLFPTIDSGGRKARPYERLAIPDGRGGLYPRPAN